MCGFFFKVHNQNISLLRSLQTPSPTAFAIAEEWKTRWKARKKGTAPGKFKVTVDMVAALPDDILDDLRVLINTILLPGRGSFRAWRRRGIVPVLKPQLDNEVDNICPINLADVFWMFIAVGH